MRQSLGWAIALMLFIHLQPFLQRTAAQTNTPLNLPTAQVHPLPPTLLQWDTAQTVQGDYFDQIKSVSVGFLIWSHWPIQVYIAPPSPGTLLKPEAWQTAITQAVRDWQPYLPLTLTAHPKDADILILAAAPQRRSGERVRSAETRFELYVKEDKGDRPPPASPILAHRMTIHIRPNQTLPYLKAAARHELGHALGLWGHSQQPADVMYFAQVRQPPYPSVRDVNTLKRIYQQPTQLGWPMPTESLQENGNKPL